MITQTEWTDLADPISLAFADARTAWVGCDWPIVFGSHGLNLENMTSAQCVLMARATAGHEADAWWEAAQWLVRIEKEALEAEKEAQTAVAAAQAGHWVPALTHARNACDIEARYHSHLIWQPLRDAIEKGLKSPP